MAQIKTDPKNYRKHGAENQKLIRKSLKEFGAGRSIVIDADDTIVAGNGVFEQAQKLGLKTHVIETDGSELVVIDFDSAIQNGFTKLQIRLNQQCDKDREEM